MHTKYTIYHAVYNVSTCSTFCSRRAILCRKYYACEQLLCLLNKYYACENISCLWNIIIIIIIIVKNKLCLLKQYYASENIMLVEISYACETLLCLWIYIYACAQLLCLFKLNHSHQAINLFRELLQFLSCSAIG